MKEEEIKKLSELARIEISPEERQKLSKDITKILAYVDQIKEVSVGEEAFTVAGDNRNVLREDKDPHESGAYSKEIIEEMPDSEDGYLKVKKIL